MLENSTSKLPSIEVISTKKEAVMELKYLIHPFVGRCSLDASDFRLNYEISSMSVIWDHLISLLLANDQWKEKWDLNIIIVLTVIAAVF